MAATNAITSEYFSGQGQMLIGDFTSDPDDTNFLAVGNATAVKITNSSSELSHRENSSGDRGVDDSIWINPTVTIEATLESMHGLNLARALQATYQDRAAGVAQTFTRSVLAGATVYLSRLNVTFNSVVDTATGLITYVSGVNYLADPVHGSVTVMTVAAQTAAGASDIINDGDSLDINIDYPERTRIHALNDRAKRFYGVAFEGLNTMKNDEPIFIQAFKCVISPIEEYNMINESITNMVLKMGVLRYANSIYDSKYYMVTKTA